MPARPPAGFAVLLRQWPGDEQRESELVQLCRFNPNLRIYTALASFQPIPETWREVAPHLEFLADGMVLEGEWRQESDLAHQLETARVDFTPDLSSEWFLQQARYAMHMRKWIERDGVKHLHAMSTAELVWGWMLHKLTGVSLSVSVEGPGRVLPKSAVIELIGSCSGVRFAKAHIMSAAASTYPSADIFFLHSHRPLRPIENEWLDFLGKAGGLTPALAYK
jgi:hypothetical protein